METFGHLDCVVVGFNDSSLDWIDEELGPLSDVGGGFKHFQNNSVRYKGHRRHYTDILNLTLTEVTGVPHSMHIAETPNLACCILKSFLEHRGFATEIVNFFNNEKEKLRDLLSLSPNAVAITTTLYTTARPVAEIVSFVRECNPDVKIVVGGPHIYNVCSDNDVRTQDYLFREMGADVFVFDSQGELALSRVLAELRNRKPDLDRVANLVYRNTSGGRRSMVTYERTRREPESNDLNEGVVDWSLFDPDFIAPMTWMRTARSCAYSCSFCRYPQMGGPLTLNDIDVLEEQFRLLESMGVRFIYFIDDTFNIPLNRFKDICRMMIRNKFDFEWASYFRCSNADEETFDLVREAGCVAVFAGIESGDQQILKNMNKAAKVEKYLRGIQRLENLGIMVYASLIVGFPGETEQTIKNTLQLIEESSPTFYSAEVYYHDPKVPINDRAEEFGLKGSGLSWEHNTMDWRQAFDMATMVHREISNSAFLPMHGGDMWSVPYFFDKGITKGQLMDFLDIGKAMVLRGFDEKSPDYTTEERKLRALFSEAAPDVELASSVPASAP